MLKHSLCTVLLSFYSLIKSLFWLRDSLKFIQVINIWSSTLSSLEPWGISKSGRKSYKLYMQFYFEVWQVLRWERERKCSLSICDKYSTGSHVSLQDKVWEETSYPKGKEKFGSRESWWTPSLSSFPLKVYL